MRLPILAFAGSWRSERRINNINQQYQKNKELSDDETKYLEEPYVPHPLAGVMAQNKRKGDML